MAQSFVQSIRFCSHRILILTLCTLTLGVSSAQAAGFWLLDQGASNFTRGGLEATRSYHYGRVFKHGPTVSFVTSPDVTPNP